MFSGFGKIIIAEKSHVRVVFLKSASCSAVSSAQLTWIQECFVWILPCACSAAFSLFSILGCDGKLQRRKGIASSGMSSSSFSPISFGLVATNNYITAIAYFIGLISFCAHHSSCLRMLNCISFDCRLVPRFGRSACDLFEAGFVWLWVDVILFGRCCRAVCRFG